MNPQDYTAGEVAKLLTYCNDQPECRRILLMHGLQDIGTRIVPPGVAFMPFTHNQKFCIACAVKNKDGSVTYTLMGLPMSLPEAVAQAFFLCFMEHTGEKHGGKLRVEVRDDNAANN